MMAKTYEQKLLEILGASFQAIRRKETSQCLITRDFSDDLQVGALISSSGAGKSLKREVRVGVRLAGVEEVMSNYLTALQQSGRWKTLRVPFDLTAWNRLSPTRSEDPTILPDQVEREIRLICDRVLLDAEVLSELLLGLLSNAAIPAWACEPIGAPLVQKSLVVRMLSGDCSRELAARLTTTTPGAAAYEESTDRFVDWLLAN